MPVAPSRPTVGSSLGQRYELVRHVATGGMGQVWEGFDTVLHRRVAVKILREDLVDAPGFLQRFRREARHAAALSHPGIAAVHDYAEEHDGGRLLAYLVMEFVDGEPLSHVIAERGPLAPAVGVSYLIQTAVALHAAHRQGVVHRDVKPGNILVLADGSVKVTDFGVAHVVDSTAVTDAGHVIGTATYLSPEQARADRVSPASDIYSLGVVGYEMLTGHPPFAASNPAALALAHVEQEPQPLPASLPRAVRDTIHAALSKDPGDRPADALTFADGLRRAVFADEVPTAVLPAVDRTEVMPAAVAPARAHGRQRWVTWATILLLLLGFVAVWAGRGPDDGVPDVPSTTVVPAASVTVTPSVAPSTTPPRTSAPAAPANNEHGKKKDKKGGGHGNG